VSVPKFPPLPSDDPMLSGLCELYQKRMNDWQRGWIFINYHFYWPPWKILQKIKLKNHKNDLLLILFKIIKIICQTKYGIKVM
jgi:hypothetical protein